MEFARKLSLVYHNFRKIVSEDLAAVENFNPGWLPYVKIISREPGIVLDELSRRLMVSKPAISKTINQLKEHNYISISINPQDARSKQVYLSESGFKLIENLDPIILKSQSQFLSTLSDAEREQLNYVLDKLLLNL